MNYSFLAKNFNKIKEEIESIKTADDLIDYFNQSKTNKFNILKYIEFADCTNEVCNIIFDPKVFAEMIKDNVFFRAILDNDKLWKMINSKKLSSLLSNKMLSRNIFDFIINEKNDEYIKKAVTLYLLKRKCCINSSADDLLQELSSIEVIEPILNIDKEEILTADDVKKVLQAFTNINSSNLSFLIKETSKTYLGKQILSLLSKKFDFYNYVNKLDDLSFVIGRFTSYKIKRGRVRILLSSKEAELNFSFPGNNSSDEAYIYFQEASRIKITGHIQTEQCCDPVSLYIDNKRVYRGSGRRSINLEVDTSTGRYIRFLYTTDYSVSAGGYGNFTFRIL